MLKFLFFIAISLMSPAFAAISVGVSIENRNIIFYEQGRFTGLLADVFQCIFDDIDESFKVVTMSQPDILIELKEGNIDIGLPFVRMPARDKYLQFLEPIIQADFLLVSNLLVENIEHHGNLRFLVLGNADHQEIIRSRGGSVAEISSYEVALDMVNNGRVDATIIPELLRNELKPILKNLFVQPYFSLPGGLYSSEKGNADINKLNESIIRCKSISAGKPPRSTLEH